MKVLRKRNEENWLRYVLTERAVLANSDHPFIVKLRYAFQTHNKLFLVMDFCPGGDLETLLTREKGQLTEERAKFYIAEIILAIKDLHSRNIIYRDLKPENVVIDGGGHALLVDFGMAKDAVSKAETGAATFCGSIKYLAPEMLNQLGHGQALDWYLLGVLLYEMIVGVTPFFSSNKDTLFNNIRYGKLKLPRTASPEL
jgi:serine/threonine protein kinase